jgi:hypothetical protein
MKKFSLNKILLGLALTLALGLGMVENVSAQRSMLSSYSLTSDTVTNTGTGYVQLQNKGVFDEVIIQAVMTELSGTTAGTVSILGSVDGVNYKAMTIRDATTAIPTYTATDVASQTNVWRITGNGALYYRVSWTGAGTMAATLSAKLLSR